MKKLVGLRVKAIIRVKHVMLFKAPQTDIAKLLAGLFFTLQIAITIDLLIEAGQ